MAHTPHTKLFLSSLVQIIFKFKGLEGDVMNTKVKSILMIIVAVAVTIVLCNIYNRNRLCNQIGESEVYSIYLSSRAIDLCYSDERADIPYQLTSAALYLQKAHAHIDSATASLLGVDSRKAFVGSIEYVARFILSGGNTKDGYIRPAAQIDSEMNKDETLFYQKLSEILQEIYSRQLSFIEDSYSLKFKKISLHDINALSLEFQTKCAALFNVQE